MHRSPSPPEVIFPSWEETTNQHKRTVHIFVDNPLFEGATKIVERLLSNVVPDWRCKLRDALGQMARVLEMLIELDAGKRAVEKMRGKGIRYVKL